MSSTSLWLQKWVYHRELPSGNLLVYFSKPSSSHWGSKDHTCTPTSPRTAQPHSSLVCLTASCSEGNHWMNREAVKIQSSHLACVDKIETLLQIILKWYKKVLLASYAYILLTELFAHLNRKTEVSKNYYFNSTFMFLCHANVICK